MNKFIAISKTFNTKEKSQFNKYVHCIFKQDTQAIAIASWLMELDWQTMNANIKLDKLHQLYPAEINLQTFKNTISELGNVAEEFISWQHWRKDEELKNISKFIALAERNLGAQFLQLEKKVTAKNRKLPISIFREYFETVGLFYNYNFQMSESKDNYSTLFNNLIRTFKKGVAKVAQSLQVEIKNREHLMSSEDWSSEMDFFDLLYDNQTDTIFIMDQLLLLNKENDNSAYVQLISILKDPSSKNLSHFIKYSILIYCTVYLHAVFKTGNHEKVNELLELYEYGLRHKLLTPSESIDTRTYLNVISVFSKLSTSEKTIDIIKKYTNKVDHADTKVIKQIAISTLDFNKGRFEKVIRELRTIEPNGFHLKFKTRWLQLKSLVEVQHKYPDVILGQIANFKRYIHSNKININKPTFDGLQATLRILPLIINQSPNNVIQKEIRESDYIFEKKWIKDLYDRSLS